MPPPLSSSLHSARRRSLHACLGITVAARRPCGPRSRRPRAEQGGGAPHVRPSARSSARPFVRPPVRPPARRGHVRSGIGPQAPSGAGGAPPAAAEIGARAAAGQAAPQNAAGGALVAGV